MYNPAFRKIEFYLYNYDKIDMYLEELKEDRFNYEYNQNYSKWIKNKSSGLEDFVIRNMDLERRIFKINKWKVLINEILKEYREKNKLKYQFIELKYYKKMSTLKIQEKLNLTLKEQKDIQIQLLKYIFLVAVKKGILEEVKF